MQIIVVTAHPHRADFITRVMQEGADDFVSKPFDEDLTTIADKIARSLRHAERAHHACCEEATKTAVRANIGPPPEHAAALLSQAPSLLRDGHRSRGANVETLRRSVRHKDLASTTRYVHSTAGELDHAVTTLPALT